MTRKHRELIQQQVQSYWQQVDTVIQQAGEILETLGQQSATKTAFKGRTYRIKSLSNERLQISVHQREPILSRKAGNIQSCRLNQADFDRFARFTQSLQQTTKIPQLELV